MRSFSGLKGIWLGLAMAFLFCGNAEARPKPKKQVRSAPSSRSDDGGGSSGDYVTEKRGDTTVKYKKKTSYDFEGLGVEAMADKPTGAYISNIKDVKAKSLIQIRKDFDAEVNETARQMP